MTTLHTSLCLSRAMFGGKTGRAFGLYENFGLLTDAPEEGRFIGGKI